MTPTEIREILDMLPGVRRIKESMDGYIHCSCFLAAHANEHAHNVDRKPSMWISCDQGVSRCDCWTCHPSLKTFIDTLEHFNTLNGGKYSHVVDRAKKFDKWVSHHRRKQIYQPVDHDNEYSERYTNDAAIAAMPRDFLREKGVTKNETIEAFRNGVDSSRGLITFPIITRGQKVVGAQARSVMGGTSGSKYFQIWTDCRKSHHLYGEHLLDLKMVKYASGLVEYVFEGNGIIVFEGPLDVEHAYECDVRNVVGIMGSQVSEEQARLLYSIAKDKPISFMLDPDAAGQQGAIESINRVFLEAAPEATVRMFVSPKDPKQLSKAEFLKVLTGEHQWRKRNLSQLLDDLEGHRGLPT